MNRMKMISVLVVSAVMFAVPAFAVISGSPHDLSLSTNTYYGDSDEMCAYCHTPHESDSTGPLWNRTPVTAGLAVYGDPSSTIDATASMTVANLQASDAALCLGCHDGASMTDALVNPPNSGAPSYTGGEISGDANLGTDLSNDHPVAFIYADASGPDNEIKATPDNSLNVSYGAAGNQMWCSSCHDVHDNSEGAFLAYTNAGSALCLSCHDK